MPHQRHTDTMENAGFEREDLASRGRVSTVELSEVSASTPSPTPAPTLLSINGTGGGATSCSEHCQALHLQHQRQYAPLTDKEAEAAAVATAGGATGRQLPESPWHHLKTVFLVGTLIFLALWILVYTLLSQLAVL